MLTAGGLSFCLLRASGPDTDRSRGFQRSKSPRSGAGRRGLGFSGCPGVRRRWRSAGWEIKGSGNQPEGDLAGEPGEMWGDDGEAEAGKRSRAKIYLYMSHTLSMWGERAWEFAVGLAILKMTHNLRLVSVYGLVSALGKMFLSASMGAFVDRNRRLKSVTSFYLLQNLSLFCAALSTWMLLRMSGKNVAIDSNVWGILLAVSMVIWGMMSSLGQVGSTLVVEKKWTKEICGDDQNSLASMNSIFRTIDLTCLVLAPILSGFLMTYVDTKVAIMEIAAFNLVAWIPEVIFARLAEKHAPEAELEEVQQPLIIGDADQGEEAKATTAKPSLISDTLMSLKLYYTESSFPAMFALALLYLTTLSFGILMTAYLKWLGLSEAVLSIYRGAGAFSGVLGARLFPFIQRQFGVHGSGCLGISVQLASLIGGVAPSIMMTFGGQINDAKLIMHFLVCGLVISRFGLWVFDLSVTQIMQTRVNIGKIGSVSGAQKLHENLFTVILYVVVVAFPRPQDFIWLMIGSLCTVGSAFAIYFIYFVNDRVKSVGENQQEVA